MSTDQADRAIAAIDAVLTDDQIDDIVDYQLSRYNERTGYDHNVGQSPCGHCAREEHGLAITERIEHMRQWGEYDEAYRYDEDTSEILCPGSFVPGPVGFRRAFEHYDHVHWAPVYAQVGEARIVVRPDLAQFHESMRRFNEMMSRAWGHIRTSVSLIEPIWDELNIAFAPLLQTGPFAVRLIDATGRPIPTRGALGWNLQPTDAGFTVLLDLPPRGLRGAIRDRGPGARIIVDGPGGARERIAGTVTDVSINDDGTRFELDVTSEHHRLPTVYTEPEENQR